MRAAENGYIATVNVLLQYHATVDLQNEVSA